MKKLSGKWPLFVVVLLGLLLVFGPSSDSKTPSPGKSIYKELKLFTEVLDMVRKNYVDEVDTSALIQGAIAGMIKTLDPHSAYLTPELAKELRVETRGQFEGIGIEISLLKDVLTVVSPIEDTPAYRAGVKSGDHIIKIDGKSTKGITIEEAVKKLRGKKGTKVTITIVRENESSPLDITLTRAKIKVRSVKSKVLENHIGYIRIVSFNEHTATDLRKTLADITEKAKPMTGLILDLRNDPGGLLNQAVEVSDMFLQSGIIVSTRGRIKAMESKSEAQNNGKDDLTSPMVVLVNGGTASAAEIVAGALQDNGRALVVGTQTFGKASVQTVIPLEDGSELKLTTARYYTPSGKSIQAEGIKPDIVVPFVKSADVSESPGGKRLRERDLQGHIKPAKEDGTLLEEIQLEKLPAPADLSRDNQLKTAVDILKSWQIMKKNFMR